MSQSSSTSDRKTVKEAYIDILERLFPHVKRYHFVKLKKAEIMNIVDRIEKGESYESISESNVDFKHILELNVIGIRVNSVANGIKKTLTISKSWLLGGTLDPHKGGSSPSGVESIVNLEDFLL